MASKKQTTNEQRYRARARSVANKAMDNRKFRKPKKKLDFQPQAIIGNLVFSKHEVWAYYAVNGYSYSYRTSQDKVSLMSSLTLAFNNLITGNDRVDCQLIETNIPLSVDMWEEAYMASVGNMKYHTGFADLIEKQRQQFTQGNYFERTLYLGVCLGRRGALDTQRANPLISGFQDTFTYLGEWLSQASQVGDYSVRDDELNAVRIKEEAYFSSISVTALEPVRCDTEELALLIKKQFYPAMPTPYLNFTGDTWDNYDIIHECGSVLNVKSNPKYLAFQQVIDGEEKWGYRATLSVSQFDKNRLVIPQATPWVYNALLCADINTPFDVYTRFTLVPSHKMRRSIDNKSRAQRNAVQDALDSGHHVSREQIEQVRELDRLIDETGNGREPWVSGIYRIVLMSDSPDDLLHKVSAMKEHYETSLGLKLTHTYHDQLDLFLESMVGDTYRDKSFLQTSDTALLGISGFGIKNVVGDSL